ncbi:hypothetical protein YTPLAS18_17220 [Nitrospira sp.]|nr:hypothetical protein YTPLAS18_17220 [Nitrospira sp.]
MTLILDCFARDAAFQVSDRRLTDIHGNAVDDETNKAVVVDGRVVFGYTGLAQIEGERTDVWLAHVIAGGPTNNMRVVADRICHRATSAFQRLRCPIQFKRHAFRGTGWFRLKDEDWFSPGLITVHNYFDHNTGDPLPEPLGDFKVSSYFPTKLPGGCFIRNVGVTPSPAERAAIVKLVRKCAKNKNATRGAVLNALIQSVVWLSKNRAYRTIGSSVMAICLPRTCVEQFDGTGAYAMAPGMPQDSCPTFLYATTNQAIRVGFAPIFVGKRTTPAQLKPGAI